MADSNIVLIGMPASGKSTIGKRLAKRINFKFIDTDRYIEKVEGKPLPQIFKEAGEEEFKKIEEKCILSLNLKNHVISTGGSVVLSPAIIEHLKKKGMIVYLHCDYEMIEKRIKDPYERTVVGSKNMSLREIYEFRLPLYKKYADKIFPVNENFKNILNEIIMGLNLK